MTPSVPSNDRLIFSKSEPILHPDASSDHLMSTALTIAFDIVDTISTLNLRARAFASQHPYLLPVCARATFSLFSSSKKCSTFNLGRRRTADGYCIKQPVVFVFFKRPTGAVESRARPWSRPLVANRLSEAVVSLSVRSDFGLSWYVV